eukprot:3836051-Pyramimonas_sp.AAC.2
MVDLWVMTSDAACTVEVGGVHAAPLWGLMRTIALEGAGAGKLRSGPNPLRLPPGIERDRLAATVRSLARSRLAGQGTLRGGAGPPAYFDLDDAGADSGRGERRVGDPRPGESAGVGGTAGAEGGHSAGGRARPPGGGDLHSPSAAGAPRTPPDASWRHGARRARLAPGGERLEEDTRGGSGGGLGRE